MYLRARTLGRLAAVAAVAVALAGCDIAVNGDGGLHFDIASGKAQDEWTRSYKVGPGGRLEIINVNGLISADVGEGPSIEVTATRTAKATSDERARELLDKIEMREEVGEARVRVEVRAPRMTGPGGHEIKWTIKVPRGVAVDLRTVNGGVKMNGLEGEIRARTTNGGITGKALAATVVDAAVTNGGIVIELARPVSAGTFDLEAVNGGVSLDLPAESKADISGRAVNGGVAVTNLPVEVLGEKSSRRLNGRLNGGGARVSLQTVNGGVKIGRSPSTT